MTRLMIKRTFKWTGIVLSMLILVTIIHVVIVTRHRVDATTRVMARIDFNHSLTRVEADKATAFLYGQKGVDHVLCNPETRIAVFTFSPLTANADDIVFRFRKELHYPDARRYKPTQQEMQSGCPVASTSLIYKAYTFIQHLF